MNFRPYPSSDPDAHLPYWFDATDFAADEGSPVVGYALAIDDNPDGALTLTGDARSGSVVSYFPVGGTVDVTYVVRCRFTLANGEVEDHSRTLTIAQH